MADIVGAAYLDALVTLLQANGTFTSTKVDTDAAPLGPQDTVGRESCTFLEITQSDDQFAMGDSNRMEETTINGVILVEKPGAGAVEAKAARDRAVALFAALKAEIYGDIDLAVTGVKASEVAGYTLRQMVSEYGRVCQIDFTIDIISTNE